MKARVLHLAAAVALVTLGAACDSAEKKTKSDASAAGSAKPKSKLQTSLEAAAAASAGAANQAPGQGPPPRGVFARGAADAEQPAGAAPKLTIIKQGEGPTVVLSTKGLPAGTRFSVNVSAVAFNDQLPGMLYALEVTGDEAKGDTDAARAVTFKVKKAELAPSFKDKVQPGAEKALAKIGGATVTGTLANDGGLRDAKVEVPKDAADVGFLADSLADALGFLFVPVPKAAVGVGATWLVADRVRLNGMEFVRYRAATLQSIKGDDVVLGIDVRHYATSSESIPKGVSTPGVETLAVESFGQATVARRASDLTPLGAKSSWPLDLVLGKGGQPAAKLHSEMQVELQLASEASKK